MIIIVKRVSPQYHELVPTSSIYKFINKIVSHLLISFAALDFSMTTPDLIKESMSGTSQMQSIADHSCIYV